MKHLKKICTSVLSLALSANTFILPSPMAQAASAEDNLIDGIYYGISENDLPGWYGAWADWKMGPITINYSGASEFSIDRASRFDKNRKDDDEVLVFTSPATKDGKTQTIKLPVNTELEKGDIYTFAFDAYVEASEASNHIRVAMNNTTAGISGSYAEVTSNNVSAIADNFIRDFGPGNTYFAGGFDVSAYNKWDTKFVRYEVIIDTEDEEYGGEQTVEINIRSKNYSGSKQHFKGTYYQVDHDNGNAKLDSTVEKINQVNVSFSSNPSSTPTMPIYFALDNIRSSVYHDSKASRDAMFLKTEKGEYPTKTFTTLPDGGAAAVSSIGENETIAFDVPDGETAVAYRDITQDGATMNIASHEASSYVYADVLVPEGESADDYYITLASMPQKIDGNTGNAVGVSLGKYYTTPGQMQRVEIPVSEFTGADSAELPNGGAQYDSDAELMFLAGIGVARKSGSGSIEIGDMYIVGDVKAPTNLTDVEVVSGKVTLNWTPSKNTMTEYEIYRGDELIGTVDGNTTEYVDDGLENDSYYSYKVRGKCLYGKYTDYAELKDVYVPAIGVPQNVSFANVGGAELAVKCNWEAPLFGQPNGYIIYRDGKAIAELSASEFEYTDRDIEPNTDYKYEICATMEGFQPSYRVSGEVLAAYVYAPENLAYDGSQFTWTEPEFAESYKLYINGREYAASDTNSYTLTEPLEKNDILTVEVKALTHEGNASLASGYIRIYEKNEKLETVRDYYKDDLARNVKIYTDNAQYATESETNVGIGTKSIAVKFTPVRKGAIMFRGAALGGDVSAVGNAVLVGMYIPQNADLQKLQVGLSYIPSVSNASVAYASVPIAKYVKETGRWTIVEIPLSDIPKDVEYKVNNQARNLQFDIKKATDICIVGDYTATDNVADILVDEIMIGKYLSGNTNLVNKDGAEYDGSNMTNDETAITVKTEAGFKDNALSGDGASVKLLGADGKEIPAVTVLDKDRSNPKIVLASQLEENGEYTVKLSGVADANGAEVADEINFTARKGTSETWTGESIDVFNVTADLARANSSFKAYVSVDDLAVSSDKLNKLKFVISTTGNAEINKDTKLSDLVLADCLANAQLSYSNNKLTVTADVTGKLNTGKPIITFPVKAVSAGTAEIKVNGRLMDDDGTIGINIAETAKGVTVTSGGSGSPSGGGTTTNPSSSDTKYGGQRPSGSNTITPIPDTLSFPDVTPEHWAYEYISTLIDKKVINGYDDGTFGPSNSVARSEFVKMIQSAFRLSGEITVSFDDVADDAWYAEPIRTVASLGIVSGIGDGKFAPNAEITRQDMCVMIKNVLDYKNMTLDKQYDLSSFTDFDDIADYAEEAINVLKQAGIIDGYDNGAFGPRDAVTRAEAAKVIALLIK